MIDVLYLVAYIALPVLTWVRSRSIAWTVISLAASLSIFGAGVSFLRDHSHQWTRGQLQVVLLLVFLVVAVIAFLRPSRRDAGMRRQGFVILLPVVVIGAFIALITTVWAPKLAFFTPVGYLMGHFQAEDNAKWLDFTSQLAAGHGIVQSVPMGGPLELVLVFVATVMGVMSQVLLHGYNEVAVAANTVVYGEYFMVIIAPLALAPLVEAKLRRPTASKVSGWVRVPGPLIWLGALVLVVGVGIVTEYGHLTFQFTAVIATLWITTFLSGSAVPRARLLTSLVIAAGMTVWLPLNVMAAVIIVVALGAFVIHGVRAGWRKMDAIGIALTLLVAIGIWEPVRSSLDYLFSPSMGAMGASGGAGGIHALANIPVIGHVIAAVDSSLFAAGGGTEAATPILGIIAAAAAIAAGVVSSRQSRGVADWIRMVPVFALVAYAIAIQGADQWLTGSGPHYGSLKFMFLTVIVVIAGCIAVGAMLLDPIASHMTMPRWGALALVVFLLVIDSLLPRAVSAFRPEQWNPAPRFANNPLSSWWPAEVKQQADQTIASNPIGCVYLPQGATVPSALTDLPDPQRAYSCTRILAGLSGADAAAQPLVDWLRREWLTNTPAWSDVYDGLAAMPDSVKNKPVILMDKGSNVNGIESVGSLLTRFPRVSQ